MRVLAFSSFHGLDLRMAKRKTASRAPARVRVAQPRQGVVVVRESRPAKVARRLGGRRTGVAGSSLQSDIRKMAIGGAGVGFIEKYLGATLPNIPLIGRKGAIALGVYMFKPKAGLLRDVGIAAAALSGYQFAKENKIDGEYDDEDDD